MLSAEHSLSEMTKKKRKGRKERKGKINRRRGEKPENPNISYHTVREFSIWLNQPRTEKILE